MGRSLSACDLLRDSLLVAAHATTVAAKARESIPTRPGETARNRTHDARSGDVDARAAGSGSALRAEFWLASVTVRLWDRAARLGGKAPFLWEIRNSRSKETEHKAWSTFLPCRSIVTARGDAKHAGGVGCCRQLDARFMTMVSCADRSMC
jgi:hypothetical protein